MAEKKKKIEVSKQEKPVITDTKIINEKKSKGYYHARAIIEIVGKPKEHIVSTLSDYIVKISKDQYVNLISYKQEKAEKAQSSEDFFQAFAEIEFLSKDIEGLMNFVIDYMPASVEVLEPSKINVDAHFVSNMLTELVGRLHTIDMEYKKSKAQNDFLGKSLGIMIQNSILILLNMGPREIEGISQIVGVEASQAKIFADKLIADGKVELVNNKYQLLKIPVKNEQKSGKAK